MGRGSERLQIGYTQMNIHEYGLNDDKISAFRLGD